MELINQHTKRIMEGCKARAKDAGLRFQDETLEYIVTNRDLLEISPKLMIPTLYDYWVHDVEILKGKGKYELYPSNPYETVINTRPAISFYNDNNPDWLNVMIFYHVLGHIDFFQNNIFFRHTWDYDFTGQALADKRLISRLRSEKGRWVDYVIEFARGVDNLVSYYDELYRLNPISATGKMARLDFYFDIFIQDTLKLSITEYVKEIERYNICMNENASMGEKNFFAEVEKNHPEFEAIFQKRQKNKTKHVLDLMQYILEYSTFMNQDENLWMKTILQIVRKTSLFFQPQIRTKIMNEGWASYWHETLFLQDERINGHEVDFARVNAAVTALPRIGLNPYALGMRLFFAIEEMADKGKYSYEFQRLMDDRERKNYNTRKGNGREYIFQVRQDFCDAMFISTFLDQDFMNRYNLFVSGKRLNRERMVWEYTIKSRKLEDYKNMLQASLYHPPHITVDQGKTKEGALYLMHHFEQKPLLKEFIANTMMGIEYLWGGTVNLETSEAVPVAAEKDKGLASYYLPQKEEADEPEIEWRRVLYTMENRKLTRKEI